ncbi:hypothetical protein BDA96_02G341000 [Sorghum bicolor]|uniref:O-methyltransferase dimerisation domain-containing protein n=1 Tax=Sorghum bicolor TaxID=4558 RepID=A0A921RT03_SORBI|nr:hypothetical protein BDA96_02G341000 [Sorghum bicolor]
MGSTAEDVAAVADEEACMYTMQLASSSILPMTLKNALELGLLEVLQKDAGKALAAEEVVARLPVAPTNPSAADMVDRMLRLLASYDVVKCQMEDKDGRRSAREVGCCGCGAPAAATATGNLGSVERRRRPSPSRHRTAANRCGSAPDAASCRGGSCRSRALP